MATKSILNVKVDAALKKEAKKLAKSLGLPLSTIVARKLEEFIEEKEIIFKERIRINKKAEAEILKMSEDIKKGRTGNFSKTFNSAKEAIEYLKAL